MARYHADNTMNSATPAVITTTYKTQMSVVAATATLCRGRIVGLSIGPHGAPSTTDCNVIYCVQRITAAGTAGTAITGAPIFPADVASRSTCGANHSAEPTFATNPQVWTRALNQRSSMQWVGQDTDANLLWPATNASGLAGTSLVVTGAAYTGPVFFGLDYEDQ
jgi:hypothetical protein